MIDAGLNKKKLPTMEYGPPFQEELHYKKPKENYSPIRNVKPFIYDCSCFFVSNTQKVE